VRRRRLAVVVLLVGVLSPACRSGGGADPRPPNVEYGTPAAPFSLVDQFGHRQRLSDFRGSVVLLTFIDPHCGGVCPLTADLLRRAKETVGTQTPLQLVAIDANPKATSVDDVRRWSVRHGMLRDWLFLTAPTPHLRRVWAEYGVQVIDEGGDVAHSSAVFLIDPTGRERGIFPIAARRGIADEVSALARAVDQIG
jgi:cytochrome oxidase Cu insertion factor (SCO1/SenC/PrrC family)